MKTPLLASIDIGSNSILLLVGRIVRDKLHIELQRKETIRLGGALDADGNLSPEAVQRGLACLRRFAALLEHVCPEHRRAVATQTLREAHNREDFLSQAASILGCQVELISGEKEAALIYQGVNSLLPPSRQARFIVDIGGRSTELCWGINSQLHAAASCPIGSIAWAQRFFGDGLLHSERFAAANQAAQLALSPHLASLQSAVANSQILGASGTAGAISKVLQQAGMPAGEISRDGLFQLKSLLIETGHIDLLTMQGLREELRPVIGGGVSVMCAVFDALQLQSMRIAQGALHHGVLFSLQTAALKNSGQQSIADRYKS